MILVIYADATDADLADGEGRQGIWVFELKTIIKQFFPVVVKQIRRVVHSSFTAKTLVLSDALDNWIHLSLHYYNN